MGCVQLKKSQFNHHNKTIRNLELQILKLMYNDLASRSLATGITRQHFDVFFHLNGLWSSSIYRKFDTHNKNFISFQNFAQNLLSMTTGDFNQKSKILYQLYTEGESSGVTFQMLTKMFYSYPIQEINKVVVDEEFLKTIDDYQLTCFFDKEHKIKDNLTLEMTQSLVAQQISKSKIHSIDSINQTKQQFATPRKISLQYLPSVKEINQNKEHILRSMPLTDAPHLEFQVDISEKKPRKNTYSNEKYLKKKTFKITSNFSFLVKKYVKYLFETFHLDLKKGRLNLQNFRYLLKNHDQIFNIYLQGFHTYVWQYNEDGFPIHTNMISSFESMAVERAKVKQIVYYLNLIKTTLFVFACKGDLQPIKIINLEGLSVKQSQFVQNCLVIYHKETVYPQQQFQFESKEIKDQWLAHLNDFVKGNVNDDFQFIETVGTGKFAKVFYGKQKATNQQVAIKMIQKSKLTKIEKQSIQKQFSILQLCHNPYIIKFYKHYETKNNLCIITQFIKDGDLFQYVKEKSFLQEYQAAIIFKQLLESVGYLNELGLIHRDLKPQNIMVHLNDQKTHVNKVKLIDFGFAIYKKQLQIASKHQKFAGTPGYIAPQILFGQSFDESVDIFSLGVILYFMLSGFLPFYSSVYEEIIEQTKICNVQLKNQHWSNVSKPAKQLIQGILTFKDDRLALKQVIEHQWLKNIESLKELSGVNKKPKTKSKKQIK